MITTDGKTHIKRYMAGWVPAIGRSIAFGIGATSETAGDKTLNLEIATTPVALTTYDFVNDKLIFKSSLPEDLVAEIYEVGLWSLEQNPSAGEYGARLISTFDS